MAFISLFIWDISAIMFCLLYLFQIDSNFGNLNSSKQWTKLFDYNACIIIYSNEINFIFYWPRFCYHHSAYIAAIHACAKRYGGLVESIRRSRTNLSNMTVFLLKSKCTQKIKTLVSDHKNGKESMVLSVYLWL